MAAMREFTVDLLSVKIYRTRAELGAAAAEAAAGKLRELLAQKERVAVIFAAAPSQNEFLDALSAAPGLDWGRVTAFQMDEYLGLPEGAPQSFGYYLRERLFEKVRPGCVHLLNGNAASPAEECRRYAQLLRNNPPDLVCLGIGENGHIAFNDPPVADFADPEAVKVIELEESCRRQQVNDGCFPSLAQVPVKAMTLTVPTLVAAPWLYCMVPGATKREAVERTLMGKISRDCPASILRTHQGAALFLDAASAALLK